MLSTGHGKHALSCTGRIVMLFILLKVACMLQVDCIHWVSAPQLALLEVAMQNMERVHAWLLNTGGGSNMNVFQVCRPPADCRQAIS